MKTTRNKVKFIIIFAGAHSLISVLLLITTLSTFWSHFDRGGQFSVIEHSISFMTAIFTFPSFYLVDLLRKLNPSFDQLYYDPFVCLVLFFNSLFWAIGSYHLLAFLSRGRRKS